MQDPGLLLAFVGAVTLLMLIPGPNVALIIANSLAHGARYGLLTVIGTASAMVVQLTLVATGLAGLLTEAGAVFTVLRWAGVVYLLVLGVRQWRAAPIDLTKTAAEPRSPGAIFGRAVLVSLTNPKTLLFYGAFLPQFMTPGRAAGPQVAVLAALALLVALIVDSGWAVLAARVRGVLGRHGRLRNRLSGGLLIGAGVVWRPSARADSGRIGGGLRPALQAACKTDDE